jgi:hypothetical protein
MDGTTGITIAALLDRKEKASKVSMITTHFQHVTNMPYLQKEKHDRDGGEAIRQAPMRILAPRKRAVPTDTDSDRENEDPSAKTKVSRRRLSKSGAYDSEAIHTDITLGLESVKGMMVSNEKRRDAGQNLMVDTPTESTRVYKETSGQFQEVLNRLADGSN